MRLPKLRKFSRCMALLLTAACNSATAADQANLTYISKDGFRVTFPPAWMRINRNAYILDIVSKISPDRRVVIAKDNAEIIVTKVDDINFDDLDSYFKAKLYMDNVHHSRLNVIKNQGTQCINLYKVSGDFDMAAKDPVQSVDFFVCRLRTVTVVTTLIHWKSDNIPHRWVEEAEEIAASSVPWPPTKDGRRK